MSTARVLGAEILMLIAALVESLAVTVGGEAFAPRYIEDLKRRSEIVR